MRNKYILLAIFGIPLFAFSQTKEERAKIASFSDKVANEHLLQELKILEHQRKQRVNTYLNNNPDAKKIVKDDENGKIELKDILPTGEPVYVSNYNTGSAQTSRANTLYSGGALNINIQGQGMTAGVWDGGSVRDTHQEFVVGGISKVYIMDGASMSNHGTHVAGTIAAQGILSTVRGVAFNSSILSYDWTNDSSEMTGEAGTGLLVSNHSYGPSLSTASSIWYLGAYINDSKIVDQLCFNNPYYLPMFAAGNDRNDVTQVPYSTQNSNKGGFDLIAAEAAAKNVLTVGAVNNVPTYAGPSSVIMSSFSNWGPTDDGRIKPEITTKGVNVRSTYSSSNTATGLESGTSMATPGITGVAVLLQQYHNTLYSNFMKAATLKGLMLHTADEAGTDPGPDYKFGWGLVNAQNAAIAIRDKNLSTSASVIMENTLNNEGIFTKTISASGTGTLKVSISWTDPAYPSQNNGVVDPATIYLVNDLDVKVTGPDGTIYYPWKLQGLSDPSSPATRASTNNVDNFERVDIDNPNGTYTITVTHKGSTLTNNAQNYSLIVTAPNLVPLSTNEVANHNEAISVYPNPTKDFLYIKNKKADNSKISIVDITGRIIKTFNTKENKLDVRDLENGSYILVYSDTLGNSKSFKFIKN